MKTKLLAEIERLEARVEKLRKQVGVNKQGETLFHAPMSMWSENDIVVEADGKGGAHLSVVEGNYPADYTTHRTKHFVDEEDACDAAENMINIP